MLITLPGTSAWPAAAEALPAAYRVPRSRGCELALRSTMANHENVNQDGFFLPQGVPLTTFLQFWGGFHAF